VGQSDLAGASDALNISTTVLLVDSASVADALVAGPGNQLSDIGAGSDMLRVSVVKLLGDGASCSDAMAQLLGLQLMPRGIGITTVIIPGSDGTRAVVSGGTLATILGLGSDNTRVVVSGGTSTVVQVSSSQSRAEPQGNRGQSSAVVQ
jgi:ribosomal protein L2